MEEEEEIIDQEIDKSVTPEELSQYLADRFDLPSFPGGQKEALTVAERLREAEKRSRGL